MQSQSRLRLHDGPTGSNPLVNCYRSGKSEKWRLVLDLTDYLR